MNHHYKTTDTKLANNALAIRFGDDSTCSSPDPPLPPQQIRKQYPSHSMTNAGVVSFSENHPNTLHNTSTSICNTKDRISITRAVYDLLVQREHMYDEAVQKRTDMRYEMEASALDIEKTTLQCRIEMESLQLAAHAKTVQHPHNKTESYFDAPYDTQHLLSMKKQMQQLMNVRERIMINRQSSELMLTHCDKLKKLESTVVAMSSIMATAREKLETAIDERSTTIHELDSNITILRSQLDHARDEITHMGEIHRAALSEKIGMTEEIGQLRNQLALVEVQANESLNISLTHHDRDKQAVARLEAMLENLRNEEQKHAVELEQWKAQARLDARQRADQTLLIEQNATEVTNLHQTLEQYRKENDTLKKQLEKTTFELEFQVSTLTTQLSSIKDMDETQQQTIQRHLEEIRTLKEDLRKAWETIEREKQDRELLQGNSVHELGELRERVNYLRSQMDIAETKMKTQRDEMDDLMRAHKTQLGDMEDQHRRCKSQLADAQAQETRLLPFQHRVEELTQTIMTLTQENKAYVLEIGLLKADNTRLSHRFHAVDTETDAQKSSAELAQKLAIEKIQHLELELVAAKGEAAQWKMNCERMQLERDTKAKEVEASHSHTSALATRKEFLAKSVTELEDLVGRLSGQVQHERALGSSTEQRIAEMRALVPYWRWEARERSERATLSITNSAATAAYLNSSSYGSSSSGIGNMSSSGLNHSLFR